MAAEKYDVVVAGAGASGVPAAVAAAREGARVALLEKSSAVGGTIRAGLGFPVCGLFLSDTTEPELVNEGLPREFYEMNKEAIEQRGRIFMLRCCSNTFQKMCRDWIEAEPNIRLFTSVSDLQIEEAESTISKICFDAMEIHPGAVIDCTGSAAVIRNCSAEKIVPEQSALAGFILRLSKVTLNDMLPIRVPHLLWKAATSGKLPDVARYTVFDGGMLKISVTPEANASQLAVDILDVLKAGLPEFRSSEIAETSGVALEREGIRLKGNTVLSEEDVLSGRKFEDTAARGCWPMEFWDARAGVTYSYVGGDGTYDIPLRALKSTSVSNLWAAGRSISADSMALSSVRVVGTCIATGEAAGRAAAKEAA